MRVAKICAYFWPVKGGMEDHLYFDGSELVKKGYGVAMLVSDSIRDGKEKLPKTDLIEGINVRRFKTLFKYSYFSPFFPGLFLHLLKERYDIIHVHSFRQFYNLALLIAKLRKVPSVITTHWPEYPESVRNKILNLAVKLFDSTIGKWILNSADKVIVQTEAEKSWLLERFRVSPKKIEIVPPGFRSIYLKKTDPKKFRKRYNINEKNMVLCIGRMHRSKGFDKVVKIASSFSDTKFVFIGHDSGFKNELENLAEGLKVSDKILFAGAVSDEEKLDALAACDVLVMPSDYEAFGIALLEAMAQGKPVIAANAGGMPDVVGNCGFVFDKNNLWDLKEKLRKLLLNKKLREKLGKLARNKAEDFTWENQVEKIGKVYKNLIENRKKI
ncbi:MAG: glycosyltransferase family 4 protein [archaeon]